MNNASEHDIDRILTALRDTEPTDGLESRILQAVQNRTPARSGWFRWTTPMQWGTAALATAAIILAIALTTHDTRRPTPTIASRDPSSPEALSPAKVGSHNAQPDPTSNLSSRPEAAHFAAAAERPAVGTISTPATYPPHQLLCDCDPIAMAEMQAPSQVAPEMPLTAQERLLQRIVRHGDTIDIAELEPLPLRAAVTAKEKEDAAVKNVVQSFLKQLAAAEAINPTPPTPEPPPAADPNANDPGPAVESPSSPN